MKKHYRHENDCLNCGTILEGKFCHNCGQENLQIKESFGHMMNHAISDYFHFDQKFFHTLKPLLFKPGYLTNEYMAGRRVQYLHPIKMYIFISIVYFLLLFQSGHEPVKVNLNSKKTTNAQKITDSVNKKITKDPGTPVYPKKAMVKNETFKYGPIVVKKNNSKNKDDDDNLNGYSKAYNNHHDTTYQQYLNTQKKLPSSKRDDFYTRFVYKRIFAYKEKYGSRANEVFVEELKHNIPKMMFVLLPLVALILKVTFWRNKKFYVEHLIYTFHLHCFLFLFLAVIMLLQMIFPENWGLDSWLSFIASIYIIWYIYRSLRVMYHRTKFRTITKMTGMYFTYLLAFAFCILLVFIITGLTAA